MSRTLAQERSLFALAQVESTAGVEKFDKLVAGLPAMILQNGFGQSLAFLLAKGTDKNGTIKENDKHTRAFDIITKWLNQRNIMQTTGRSEPVRKLAEMSQQEYLHAQEESLALLEWVKRYANAGLFK
ncbi:MAG: type III-B CRISPR module-associated protein Cmr5 [Deltaproteobacteria bacterium]